MSVGLILTALGAVLFGYFFRKWLVQRRMWKYVQHIPGPKGVPILGTIPRSIKSVKNGTYFKIKLEDCLKYKTLHRYYSFNFIRCMVYNPDDIETILTDMKLITKGAWYEIIQDWLGTGLVTSTGAKWQTRRKIITPAFHFSILQDFLIIFNRETQRLIDKLMESANEPIDVLSPITEYTLSTIGETSLGVNISQEQNSKEYKDAVVDFGVILTELGFRPWLRYSFMKYLHPAAKKIKNTVKVLHNFSTNVIQKRKQQMKISDTYSMKKRMALLDLLLKARTKNGVNIDDEGIREEVDTFMFGGHDTTSVSLCYTLVVLANEQKIQEELYQEIVDIMGEKKYPDSKDLSNMMFMERVIKESLRLYPSVPNIMRQITKDVKTKEGYIIPKGCEVDVGIYQLHRMPHIWENPDKFDPDRFFPENIATRHPFAYIPFSAGPRNCIGQKYAMMELKATLCGILRAFKLEPITKCSDLKFKLDIVLRPDGELLVKFVPRPTS